MGQVRRRKVLRKALRKGFQKRVWMPLRGGGPRQEATNLVIGEPTGPRGLQVRGVIE